jgi:hypothetical protein
MLLGGRAGAQPGRHAATPHSPAAMQPTVSPMMPRAGQPTGQQQPLQTCGSRSLALERLLVLAGKLPNQAETLFNPSDRSEEFVAVAEPPNRSVADLDYLSVRVLLHLILFDQPGC